LVRRTPEPVQGASKRVTRSQVDDDDDERPSKAASATKKAAPSHSTNGDQIRAGWTAAQETADSTSSYAQNLKLQSNVQIIKFLQPSPYASFRRHWIDRVGVGKRAYTCLQSFGKECPLCNIGDKASSVTAFNVAVVGDDGEPMLKSWDTGVKIMNVIKGFASDPKVGPLDKASLYFGVSKSTSGQRQQVQTNLFPIRSRDLEEDYGIKPLSAERLESLAAKVYDAEIIPVSTRHELDEIAAEMIDEDAVPSKGGWDND
jgi:hypothetical protein